jgi:polyhydroxyalkanoate synthesis repressor PhaR
MKRIVKRYGNRKLYDTRESRYITLEEIASYVRDGEDVTVVDNRTGADLTSVAFAQIILEEERRASGSVSLPSLRQMIRREDQPTHGVPAEGIGGFDTLGGLTGGQVDDLVNGGVHLGNGGHRPID